MNWRFFLLLIGTLLAANCNLRGQLNEREDRYNRADSIAKSYMNHSLLDLKLLANKLTHSLSTDKEKIRAIYTWVCLNITSDYKMYLKNKREREKRKTAKELDSWNQEFSRQVFRRLLTEKKTICTGYAYLVRELALHSGIPCIMVDGYGRTIQANVRGKGVANHTWNAVQLDNKWFLCDPTWSSGSIDLQTGRFIKKYSDIYFLADAYVFSRNHYPVDTAWLLLKQKPSLHEFLNSPLVYTSAIRYQMLPKKPEVLDLVLNRDDTLSITLGKNETNYKPDKIEFLIKSNAKEVLIAPRVQEADDNYQLSYVFSRKGNYTLDVLLDMNFAIKYYVRVN